MEKQYGLNDIVQMKEPHACGTNRWQVIRVGADIKIKCVECTRIVMMSREKFDKGLKKILESQN